MKYDFILQRLFVLGSLTLLGAILLLAPFSLQHTSTNVHVSLTTLTLSVAHADVSVTAKELGSPSGTGDPSGPPSWWDLQGWFDRLIEGMLAFFPTMAYGLLNMIGFGFDQLIKLTIVDFGTLYSGLAGGITAAWAGFRDIANIILIAMFVFVAINVILNIGTYGLKNFGAKLVLVALLINFSLFFTQAFIDINNLLAGAFYHAISLSGDGGISQAIANYAGMGVGFMEPIINLYSSVGLGKAFLYVSMVTLLYGMTAAVLLYGTIILITRAVTLIVLMMLSAPAFATMIIPGLTGYWKKWLSALINNAIFAPVFMMMLWASMTMMAPSGTESVTSLNLVNVIKGGNGSWDALLHIFIIVGLLYASLKIAQGLSLQGAGFATSSAHKVMGFAARATGVGLAAQGGLAMRNYGASKTGSFLMNNGVARRLGGRALGAQLRDLSETKHIGGTALGKKLKGFGVNLGQDMSKSIEKNYEKMGDEQGKNKARAEAESNISNPAKLSSALSAQKKELDAVQEQFDTAAQPHKNEISVQEKKKRDLESEMEMIKSEVANSANPPAKRNKLKGQYQAKRNEMHKIDNEIHEITTRMNAATQVVQQQLNTKRTEYEAVSKEMQSMNADPEKYKEQYVKDNEAGHFNEYIKEKAPTRIRDTLLRKKKQGKEERERQETQNRLKELENKPKG